jgi:hypothetical protein
VIPDRLLDVISEFCAADESLRRISSIALIKDGTEETLAKWDQLLSLGNFQSWDSARWVAKNFDACLWRIGFVLGDEELDWVEDIEYLSSYVWVPKFSPPWAKEKYWLNLYFELCGSAGYYTAYKVVDKLYFEV